MPRIIRSLRVALIGLFLGGAALAQSNSNPGWTTGTVPTANDWNALWSGKVDAVGGFSTNQTLTTPILNSPTIPIIISPNPVQFIIGGTTIPFPGPSGPYLPLAGGTLIGNLNLNNGAVYQQGGVTVLNISNGNFTPPSPFPSCLGNCTTLVGAGAGSSLAVGDYLTTAVGFNALHSANSSVGLGTESTAVGWNAGGNLTGTASYTVTILGVNALGSCTTGCTNDISIGTDSMRDTLATTHSVAIGEATARFGTFTNVVALGHNAHRMQAISTQSGSSDIAIGNLSMFCPAGTTPGDNVAIGDTSLANCTTATQNVVIGVNAAEAETTGHGLVYVGWKAGTLAVGSSDSTCLGILCLGLGVFSGNHVNAIGSGAGANATSAAQVNILGTNGCINITSAGNVTCIGDGVGPTLTTGSRNILIGSGGQVVDVPTASTVGFINIENVWRTTNSFTPLTSTSGVAGAFGAGTFTANQTLTVGDPVGGAGPHIGIVARAVPTLSSCGTSPSIDATASDTAGTVTEGATATGCTVTFEVNYLSAPHCIVSSWAGNSTLASLQGVAGSGFVVTNGSASGDKFTYACFE